MFRKYNSLVTSYLVTAILTCAIPLTSYAAINESIQLTFDPDYRSSRIIRIEDERIILGLSNFDSVSNTFTDQWSLYSVDNNYELTKLFQYPEGFDLEVGVNFLSLDNTLYSVAWEGIYQVDMASFTAQKIARPEVVTPTATMEAFNYDCYRQTFVHRSVKHLYTYESAYWDENSLQTLAKISRLEDGEFVDYLAPGFTQGARTSKPSVHSFGLSFRDEENLYILPDEGELLSFPIPSYSDTTYEAVRFNSYTYFSGDSELIRIRQADGDTFIQEVLLDLNEIGESLLATVSTAGGKFVHDGDPTKKWLSRVGGNFWAFATVDEHNVYRIHQVTEKGLLPPITVDIPDSGQSINDQSISNQNIRNQITSVYLHPSETFGVLRVEDSFLIYDATTGQIKDPDNRFEDTKSTEAVYYLGDAILVLEKPSRFAQNLSKATLIDKNLNGIDVTYQIDSSITPDCLYFSYFSENGFLNNDVVNYFLSSRCPDVGHYVVTEPPGLVQAPIETDKDAWRYSNSYFVFNNQRHSLAGSVQGDIYLLSWHGSDDFDLDGVADSDDAFPDDLTESADNDSDGTGDNADTDDDNDGIMDVNDPQPFVANVTETAVDDSSSNSSSGGTTSLYVLYVLLFAGMLRRVSASKYKDE